MSNCPVCGEAPSTCRCKLDDPGKLKKLPSRYAMGLAERKSPALPLDLPPAQEAMTQLEKAWRRTYADVRWLEAFLNLALPQEIQT